MQRLALGLLIGGGVGAALALLFSGALRRDEASAGPDPVALAREVSLRETAEQALAAEMDRRERAEADLAEARREVARVQQDLAEATAALEAQPSAAPAAAASPEAATPAGPAGEAEVKAAVKQLGKSLQKIMFGDADDELAAFRAVLARAGPEGVEQLFGMIDEAGSDFMQQLVVAHAIAQSGDPAAVRRLAAFFDDPDRGLLERRTAAHGLAFSDDPSLTPVLRRIAEEDPDTGARANAAFGLVRREDAEGVRLYAAATDAAFEKSDPGALQYLSGFSIMGKKGLPAIRERVNKYQDAQARIVLIQMLAGHKDREAVPMLRTLSGDGDVDPQVRKAAEEAVKAIEAN